MIKTLISIPVHERPDIVAGHLANIAHYMPNALVCLHVSATSAAPREEFEALGSERVLVNPVSWPTLRGQGLMHAHVVNYRFAAAIERFERVLLLSSNELFIRQGAEAHLGEHALGAQIECYDPSHNWHVFRRRVHLLPPVIGLLRDLRLPIVFGGQAEGQFYDSDLFAEIAELYDRHFFGLNAGFETEEIVPQTVAAARVPDTAAVTLPITFQNYCNFVEISTELVAKILTGKGIIHAETIGHTMRSPHVGQPVLDRIFSLKRIPREDCLIRRFILGLKDRRSPLPDPRLPSPLLFRAPVGIVASPA